MSKQTMWSVTYRRIPTKFSSPQGMAVSAATAEDAAKIVADDLGDYDQLRRFGPDAFSTAMAIYSVKEYAPPPPGKIIVRS